MNPRRNALVFGGSGQIGAALIPRLRAAGWRVTALSRTPQTERDGLRWLRGEFAALPVLPRTCDAVFSCGPLDLFSMWYARAEIGCPRVIAFGSTSMDTKHVAADAGERALARRLREAETRIFEAATARCAGATLLRPTLIYGAGRDSNLTRIAVLAARTGLFLLPRRARGLRQPVHVDDLAVAALAAIDQPASRGRGYALPGGETLPYRDMVARTLAVLSPPPRLIELPSPLFRLALLAAHATGRLRGLPAGAVARMREDLVFDAAPARRDLGYTPRMFAPTADMFAPPPPAFSP